MLRVDFVLIFNLFLSQDVEEDLFVDSENDVCGKIPHDKNIKVSAQKKLSLLNIPTHVRIFVSFSV